MDLGTRLREARESRGLTVRQVGDITKLSMSTVRCIEAGEFEALPGGILIRGYLRAYATAIGLAPEEIVREYLSRYAEGGAITPEPESPQVERRHSWCMILALAVAVAAAAVAYSWQTRSGERTEVAPAVGAFRLTLDMQSSGVCHVWVSADGQRAIDRLFQSGERASVSAQDELLLRVGEPAVFAYTLNGVRGRQLGESGQAVTVRITRDNYEAFLQPRAKEAPPVPANLT